MPNYYYLNSEDTDSDGDHEVHKAPCPVVPSFLPAKYKSLGLHEECSTAVVKARRLYPELLPIDGCYHCSRACHRT